MNAECVFSLRNGGRRIRDTAPEYRRGKSYSSGENTGGATGVACWRAGVVCKSCRKIPVIASPRFPVLKILMQPERTGYSGNFV